MNLRKNFEIAAGTIMGRDHVIAGRNNQDAYYIYESDRCIIALVADGCSEGKHSEVGAQLGVRLFAQAILRNYQEKNFWEKVQQDVLTNIRQSAQAMGRNLVKVINDYFLFTVVGIFLNDYGVQFFSIGDGIFFVNDEMIRLGPFPDNAPPYLCYELIGTSLSYSHPELLKIQLHKEIPASNFVSCLIGTDGVVDLAAVAKRNIPGKQELVGPVNQFWTEERYFTNSDMVRRRLSLINRESIKPDWENKLMLRESGLLPDDTTLITIRRKILS